MKIEDIDFLKIKNISGDWLSLGHYNNKPIIMNIENLEIKKEIYKDENKMYMDIDDEDIKIISTLENYICKHVYKKNEITIEFNKFKEQTFKSIFKKEHIKIEVHKNCLLLEEDQQSNKKVIEAKELKEKNYINIKIHFVGIKFFEKIFEPIFLVRKIIKHKEYYDNVSIFSIESDNNPEEEKKKYIDDFLLNDNKITNIINEDYPIKTIEL
jgi:phosphoribosylaminoimidazole carboxylase (NCAIR synthetase)